MGVLGRAGAHQKKRNDRISRGNGKEDEVKGYEKNTKDWLDFIKSHKAKYFLGISRY